MSLDSIIFSIDLWKIVLNIAGVTGLMPVFEEFRGLVNLSSNTVQHRDTETQWKHINYNEEILKIKYEETFSDGMGNEKDRFPYMI